MKLREIEKEINILYTLLEKIIRTKDDFTINIKEEFNTVMSEDILKKVVYLKSKMLEENIIDCMALEEAGYTTKHHEECQRRIAYKRGIASGKIVIQND